MTTKVTVTALQLSLVSTVKQVRTLQSISPPEGQTIVGAVENTASSITQIADQTESQASSAEQVQAAIKSVSETTESSAVSAEELAASAEELGAQAQSLQDLVAKFND